MGNIHPASTRLTPHRHRTNNTPRRESRAAAPNDGVQLYRRVNLRSVLIELDWLGVCSYENQAAFLGFGKRQILTDLLRGTDITTSAARDVEWAMQKRCGWMDEDHRGEPLDD